MALPDFGSKVGMFSELRRSQLENLRTNFDMVNRSGQIGPEVGQLLERIGPRGLQKALRSGQLQLDINALKPFVGLRYNF